MNIFEKIWLPIMLTLIVLIISINSSTFLNHLQKIEKELKEISPYKEKNHERS